jgi:hypothetical protein
MLVLLLPVTAEMQHVVDQASTLTQQQVVALESRMKDIYDAYNFDTVIMTTNPGFPHRYHYDGDLTPNAENRAACFTVTSLYIGALPG